MFNQVYTFLTTNIIGELAAFFLGFAVLFFIVRKSLAYMRDNTRNQWVSSLARALYYPSGWIILGYGLCRMIEMAFREHAQWRDTIVTGRYIFMVFMVAILSFRWKNLIEKAFIQRVNRYSKNKKNDRIVIAAVSKVASIVMVIVAGMMMLDLFGLPLQGLLAFGGMSGIAVSWAAKDVVANFFGGLMIYINRPFVIGDWIKSPNKNFEGTVEDIGMYMTRICTFEKRPMYIPNAIITDAIVENPGRMYNRRIKATITLRYEDMKVIKKVIHEVEAMLRSHPEIDQKQTLMVHLVALDTYFLGVNVYTFTKTTLWAEYRRVQQDVLLKIADIVDANGAEITVPISKVELEGSFPPKK
jgi:MscS family membrane protein